MLGPKRKYFQTATDKNSSEQLRKLEKNKTVWSQKSSKEKKIMTDFAHFPRPGENYPYDLRQILASKQKFDPKKSFTRCMQHQQMRVAPSQDA